ncbi:MAG: hypothetical protein FRX49_08921 [Trebouxia sp. A1-2]|nr:MAG: hypothetical protein FRX49_08921 [Trebouxia sp. A1-2]
MKPAQRGGPARDAAGVCPAAKDSTFSLAACNRGDVRTAAWSPVFVHEALLGGSWLLVQSWLLRRDLGTMQEAELEAELAAAQAYVLAAVHELELQNGNAGQEAVPGVEQAAVQAAELTAALEAVQKPA